MVSQLQKPSAADSFIKEEDVNVEPSHRPLFQFPAVNSKPGEETVNKFAYQRKTS